MTKLIDLSKGLSDEDSALLIKLFRLYPDKEIWDTGVEYSYQGQKISLSNQLVRSSEKTPYTDSAFKSYYVISNELLARTQSTEVKKVIGQIYDGADKLFLIPRSDLVLKVHKVIEESDIADVKNEYQLLKKQNYKATKPVFAYGMLNDEHAFLSYALQQKVGDEDLRRAMPPRCNDALKKLHITLDLIRSLQRIHHHGIIHRDIKPRNIVMRGNHAAIIDFDAAISAGVVDHRCPVPSEYKAPECYVAKPVMNEATDIFSLGVVLFELWGGSLRRHSPQRFIPVDYDSLFKKSDFGLSKEDTTFISFHLRTLIEDRADLNIMFSVFNNLRLKLLKQSLNANQQKQLTDTNTLAILTYEKLQGATTPQEIVEIFTQANNRLSDTEREVSEFAEMCGVTACYGIKTRSALFSLVRTIREFANAQAYFNALHATIEITLEEMAETKEKTLLYADVRSDLIRLRDRCNVVIDVLARSQHSVDAIVSCRFHDFDVAAQLRILSTKVNDIPDRKPDMTHSRVVAIVKATRAASTLKAMQINVKQTNRGSLDTLEKIIKDTLNDLPDDVESLEGFKDRIGVRAFEYAGSKNEIKAITADIIRRYKRKINTIMYIADNLVLIKQRYLATPSLFAGVGEQIEKMTSELDALRSRLDKRDFTIDSFDRFNIRYSGIITSLRAQSERLVDEVHYEQGLDSTYSKILPRLKCQAIQDGDEMIALKVLKNKIKLAILRYYQTTYTYKNISKRDRACRIDRVDAIQSFLRAIELSNNTDTAKRNIRYSLSLMNRGLFGSTLYNNVAEAIGDPKRRFLGL